jgi:hypothetical protein
MATAYYSKALQYYLFSAGAVKQRRLKFEIKMYVVLIIQIFCRLW